MSSARINDLEHQVYVLTAKLAATQDAFNYIVESIKQPLIDRINQLEEELERTK